jgi:phosphoglycolate phosphatase
MKYKFYIFDFDFTLADATPGIVESVNYALIRLDLKPENRDNIRKTVGMTLKDTFFKLTGITDTQLSEQFAFYFKIMADQVMTENTVLFNDSINVLTKLKKKGCGNAIVTSKFHYRIDEVLCKYGITELIDYIVGYEDVDTAKPAPQGLLKAVAHFGSDKRSVLYIGDSLIDANTAVNAEIDFAAVITGTTGAQEFSRLPYIYIANDLTTLMEYIGIV